MRLCVRSRRVKEMMRNFNDVSFHRCSFEVYTAVYIILFVYSLGVLSSDYENIAFINGIIELWLEKRLTETLNVCVSLQAYTVTHKIRH